MPKILRCLFFGLIPFVFYTTLFAAGSEPLGAGYFSLKVGNIEFTEDVWEENDIEKSYYVAIDWYGDIGSHFYVGGELGYTKSTGEKSGTDTELIFVPFEINLKYALAPVKTIQLDFGVGASYSYVEGKVAPGTIRGKADEDFLLGAQGFMNINFVFKRFFIGADAKYQVTEHVAEGLDFDNYRIGAHIGLTF